MARASLNNPSVIIYGFLNESCSDTVAGRELYRKVIAAIRAEDDSRLISYASNRFERDICFDLADIISINPYPGWISECDDWTRNNMVAVDPAIRRYAEYFSKAQYSGKPLLVSEIGACGIYGIRSRERVQWSEEYQSDYFEEAIDAILGNSRYCGIALWQMIDCKSYVNSGQIRCKPRGFNNAGLLDEYRRPKLAFDTVKRLFHHYASIGR
jgi:beta-glucuronidase